MADLKSVAGLFGMTVSELEQFTGYSRQEFHRVMDNGKAVGTARMMDTIRKLDTESYNIYSAAVSQADMSAPLSHAVRRIATTTIVMNTSDQMMRWARISKAPMPCKAWK